MYACELFNADTKPKTETFSGKQQQNLVIATFYIYNPRRKTFPTNSRFDDNETNNNKQNFSVSVNITHKLLQCKRHRKYLVIKHITSFIISCEKSVYGYVCVANTILTFRCVYKTCIHTVKIR